MIQLVRPLNLQFQIESSFFDDVEMKSKDRGNEMISDGKKQPTR